MEVVSPSANRIFLSSQSASLNFSASRTQSQLSLGPDDNAAIFSASESSFSISYSRQTLLAQLNASAPPSAPRPPAGTGAIDALYNSVTVDPHVKNKDSLESLSPDLLRDYLSLVGSLFNDDERLKEFVKGVSSVLDALAGDGSDAPPSPQADSPQPRALLIGESVSFSVEGHLEAVFAASANGEVQIQRASIDFSLEIEAQSVTVQNQSDPLVLDLDHDGKISVDAPDPSFTFDINGDGREDTTSFVGGGDGFLALDRNSNGIIDSGNELFGDQNGSANGFAELAKFDSNQDGVIDARDEIFEKLLIARRGSGGGVEISTLSQNHIRSISLGYRSESIDLGSGNSLTESGAYVKSNGEQGLLGDVKLSYRA